MLHSLAEDFMFWKASLPVSTFPHLNPIFCSSQRDHLQMQIKSCQGLPKNSPVAPYCLLDKIQISFHGPQALAPSLTLSPTPHPYSLSSHHIGLLSSVWGVSFHLLEWTASHSSVWNVRPPGVLVIRPWFWSLSQLKPQLFRAAFLAHPNWTQTPTPSPIIPYHI